LRAVAALAPEALEEALRAGAEIVAVNTLTRHLPPAAAAAVAEQVARRCLAAGAGSLFKKIDSRLRGHACAEAVPLR
jgi:D-threonate/D-erythronate kinase